MISPTPATTPAPLVLVPGFWLGAWAWDEVAAPLRAAGHEVTALTLPGLESPDADRSAITMADHVDAIAAAVRQAHETTGRKAVLAVHSGAGASGYGAVDRSVDHLAAVVYVDSAPANVPLDPSFEGAEHPLAPTWEELGENLDGIPEEKLAEFRARAVPEPATAIRTHVEFEDDRRKDVPTVLICTAFSAAEVQAAIPNGWSFMSGLPELTDVRYIDLPTSHWPMWSKAEDTARILAEVAAEFGA